MFGNTRWFLKELERRDRAHEEQVSKLLDRILLLADKPLPDTFLHRLFDETPDPFLDVLSPNDIPYPEPDL